MNKQAIIILFAAGILNCHSLAQLPSGWKSHDMARPRPPVVHPAELSLPVPPPSDAQVLFDGKDLSQWQYRDGGPADWKVENGYMEVREGAGSIWTRAVFGGCPVVPGVVGTTIRRWWSGSGEQWPVPDGSLRGPSLEFLSVRHICGRPGRGSLRPVSPAGQRLAGSRGLAGL